MKKLLYVLIFILLIWAFLHITTKRENFTQLNSKQESCRKNCEKELKEKDGYWVCDKDGCEFKKNITKQDLNYAAYPENCNKVCNTDNPSMKLLKNTTIQSGSDISGSDISYAGFPALQKAFQKEQNQLQQSKQQPKQQPKQQLKPDKPEKPIQIVINNVMEDKDRVNIYNKFPRVVCQSCGFRTCRCQSTMRINRRLTKIQEKIDDLDWALREEEAGQSAKCHEGVYIQPKPRMNQEPNEFMMGEYGWSYMPPTAWSVPQRRPPVCLVDPSNKCQVQPITLNKPWSEYLDHKHWKLNKQKINTHYNKNFFFSWIC